MINLLDCMKEGNERQQSAYFAIHELNIMNDLIDYNPVLCGTVPIGIDVKGSDLDIIMEANDLNSFGEKIYNLYDNQAEFRIKRTNIRGQEVVKANFVFKHFDFELFGQSEPVHEQTAYLHMVIEHKLLMEDPSLKGQVIQLKEQGYKTEPAFCKLLGISGDSYEGLIRFGIKKSIVAKGF
ncbi:DUF4269 domain-containing protein [Virgibacillus necropolis]|uniref:DUF4269 domain-containing protein n=1 Tax=Virgibacillus necropolis TaxID=163877 RepID=UPI00384F98F0